MKKIAFIIIRYGIDVNGGSEVHCRMLAERLCPDYDVEVLTTTARVFKEPAQDYPEGVSTCNGVTVRRFTPEPIHHDQYRLYGKQCKTARRLRINLHKIGLLRPISNIHAEWSLSTQAEKRLFEAQATHAPALLRFLEAHHHDYAALIFINFYVAETIFGTTIAPEKSLLVPLAHPDKPLYYSLNAPMFTRVRHIAFNTDAERRLCQSIFGRALAPSSIVGCSIEESPAAEWEEVQSKYQLPEQYVLYLGRVAKSKLGEILSHFCAYKKKYDSPIKLVLVGGLETTLDFSNTPDILCTGYVSEEEKSAIIRHATVIVNPSTQESLSLLMLEAMQNSIPLLVNGHSAVMKDHCLKSGAALWYTNRRDFGSKLHQLITNQELRHTTSKKGPAYVHKHYDWDVIIPKLKALIESF